MAARAVKIRVAAVTVSLAVHAFAAAALAVFSEARRLPEKPERPIALELAKVEPQVKEAVLRDDLVSAIAQAAAEPRSCLAAPSAEGAVADVDAPEVDASDPAVNVPPAVMTTVIPAEGGERDRAMIDAPARAESPIIPAYPEAARRRGEEGTVVVEFRVDAAGLALDVKVAVSSSHPLLDAAAVNAVAEAKFIPAESAGKAVSSLVRMPIGFVLDAASRRPGRR